MQPARTISIQFHATYEAIRRLGEAITQLLEPEPGIDEGDSYGVQLAAHEICTNIVDHAYQGRPTGLIEARLTLTGPPRRLEIELRDQGAAFDPTAVQSPNLDEPQEGGYGLYLAHALVDQVTYQRQGNQNVWRLVKSL